MRPCVARHQLLFRRDADVLFYTCYKFFSHHRSPTMGSFGFHYSDVVLNIEHMVVDGISNGNAHGPSRNEFTSPVYFQSVFTIRIFCAILLEVSKHFSFQRRKKGEEKGRRRKRILIVQIGAKYVFERRFTAKHLTTFGLFRVHLSTRRAEKRKREKEKKKRKRKTFDYSVAF